ncbi:MAG: dihydroorotate dehydrogenase [Actinomycetota bacterium]|nr:dihydroorotate dehydrogenase [Actinomycetota bacterium]
MVARAAHLDVQLCGIPLRTPLLPAAGTLAAETVRGVEDVYGAIIPKTATPEPRAGNPTPRISETAAGMVNSIGLQNPGIDRFLAGLDDYDVGLPIFVSVAGETVAQFARLCELVAADGRASAVELNLSCPNVEHGGLTFCSGPAVVLETVEACRAAVPGRPLFVKLTNEGVLGNALAAEEAGADGLTLINTVPALTIDAAERRVLVRGGLSGPAIKPIALRAVHEVAGAVGVPVVGCGGVSSGSDVAEFMLAGASAVQVGSGSFVREPREILDEFAAYLRRVELAATELTGGLL